MINKQNRSKILLSIIAILLVANIAMVYFFLMKKDDDKQRGKRPDRRAMIADFLKKDIGFDMVQLQQYDTLSNLHKEDMKKMFDSLGMAKDKQFKELVAGNFSDSVINVVAEKSGASQKIMEQQMFGHLKNIRKLCKPEQQSKFDSLFVKVLTKRNNDGKKRESENK
jgi:hypothetical protein